MARRLLAVVAALTLGAAGLIAPAAADGATGASAATDSNGSTDANGVPGALGRRGRWMVDAHGRVVVLHGVNMVAKLPPYDPGALGFDGDDAAFLAAHGFNTVRLGIIYAGFEPQRGVYDDAYIERIAQTARTLGQHGIHVIVDFHQDMFNERFNGEGFPDWAVIDDGLPAQPDGGFPFNYFVMPALWRAYDHFWANDRAPDGTPLWDAFVQAWRRAAVRLAQEPAIVGFDVLNEPWPGSTWTSCVNPAGCPLFDKTLSRFFAQAFDAIREVDDTRLVFYETHPVFGGGADVSFDDMGDERAGFSFHVYCLGSTTGLPSELLGEASCPLGEDRPFERANAQAERTDDTLILSEFGATDDLSTIARDIDAADRHMVSWQYWSYWNEDPCCERPHEGILHDIAQPPAGDNVKWEKLDVLVRPYPRAVAGTPTFWRFDDATKTFELAYDADVSIGAPTEIVVPARDYPSGYAVQVEGPALVTSAPGAAVLTLAPTGPGAVRVTVTP